MTVRRPPRSEETAATVPHPELAYQRETVLELVARFELRGRADSSSYLSGTALAANGRVRIVSTRGETVEALVDDAHQDGDAVSWRVVLSSTGRSLRSSCACGGPAVCAHAVAAAHAVWLRHLTGETRT